MMAHWMDDMVVHFYTNYDLSTDDKRAPLTAFTLQATGSPRVW